MGRNRKFKYLVGDFETTVYSGQTSTEVWASALVEMYTEDVHIFHSIADTYHYLKSLDTNIVLYYHNLKFDGSFWLYYFMHVLKLKPAIEKTGTQEYDLKFKSSTYMQPNTYNYSISAMGQWYSIRVMCGRNLIEIRDSLKLLPFSVEKLGKDFKTKHQKLDMEYTGYRYPGCTITEQEKHYIANDVLVVKEALEIMFSQGHTDLTIGSSCLREFKKLIGKNNYDVLFPNLYEYDTPDNTFGERFAGEYIRHSYKGGWCYLVPEKANKIYKHGITADVNSLYPSMMHSESGNRYPIGYPTFWSGNYIPPEAEDSEKYFFIRLQCRFKIRDGYLPFIQIKGSHYYPSTEMLTSSDFVDRKTGIKYRYRKDENGELIDSVVTLTLTCTDYYLFREHYETYDLKILDGCYFRTRIGIFDEYINHYRDIKITSKGAVRQIAKLFLNNLYGKLASSPDSSFKYAIPKDESLTFVTIFAYDKTPGYIPIGSAITSYARNFTIRTAQKNYHGNAKRGFIYADTDSIHCDLEANELVDVPVHPTAFCHWKLESTWNEGLFVRQKTYIEHVVEEDCTPIDEPYYNVKCAGMPEKCKKYFLENYKIEDFKLGLELPGKLMPKRIKGGTLLVETTYKMH